MDKLIANMKKFRLYKQLVCLEVETRVEERSKLMLLGTILLTKSFFSFDS